MMYDGGNSFAGPAILLLIVGVTVIFGCLLSGLEIADFADVVRDDNAVVLAEQRTLAAEAKADEAEEQRLEAEARAEEQRELTRGWEARANFERAAGERAQSDADAYTTKRMADAAHDAIDRQGRLLTGTILMNRAQAVAFNFVAVLGIAAVVGLAYYNSQERKQDSEKEKGVEK